MGGLVFPASAFNGELPLPTTTFSSQPPPPPSNSALIGKPTPVHRTTHSCEGRLALHIDPRLALDLGLKASLHRRSPPRGRRAFCAGAEAISYEYLRAIGFKTKVESFSDNCSFSKDTVPRKSPHGYAGLCYATSLTFEDLLSSPIDLSYSVAFDSEGLGASSNFIPPRTGLSNLLYEDSLNYCSDLSKDLDLHFNQFTGFQIKNCLYDQSGTHYAGQRTCLSDPLDQSYHQNWFSYESSYNLSPNAIATNLLDTSSLTALEPAPVFISPSALEAPNSSLAHQSLLGLDASGSHLSNKYKQVETSNVCSGNYNTRVATLAVPEHLSPRDSLLLEGKNTSTNDFNVFQHTSGSSSQSWEHTASVTDPSSPTSSNSATSNTIQCTWPLCTKTFSTRIEYNHHGKNHSRPFRCKSCLARHATKRQLDRHINEKHNTTEKYYCIVTTCKRSLVQGGKPFPRDDGCRKHMRRVHGMTEEQVKECGMDERTRIIRAERKLGRIVGV